MLWQGESALRPFSVRRFVKHTSGASPKAVTILRAVGNSNMDHFLYIKLEEDNT